MLQIFHKFASIQLMKGFLISVAAALGLAAGGIVDHSLQRQASVVQLKHDTEQLLQRIELIVDQTIIEVMNLSSIGISNCSSEALAAARIAVFSRATLKDVQVRDANDQLACSANPAATRTFSGIETRARNGSVFLGIAENVPAGLLHLRWKSNPNSSLVAMIGVDSLLYGFFDSSTRDQSSVGIFLDKRLPIATFGEVQRILKPLGGFDLQLTSERYPLNVHVSVPEVAIASMMAANGNSGVAMVLVGILAAIAAALALKAATRQLNPVEELALAIERQEIVPFYQPIIKLNDESIRGCEILVRWIKPDGSIVRPDLFIPLAESSGLIASMTLRTMRQAIQDLMPIIRVEKDFKLAINISADHFSSDGFLSSILGVLAEKGLDPSFVVLELTERQQLQDVTEFKAIADAVQAVGLRISIDDVGTGHNGLSTIQDVPANIIKIDKKFVDTITTNELSAAIVSMLVGLSRKFGRTIVAEGIETREQLEALLLQGVDEGQGYLFSPALDALHFVAFYGSHEVAHEKTGLRVGIRSAA